MKKSLLSILFIVFGCAVFAQVDRTKAPEPGPAPIINLDEPQSFTLKNGLTVIVVENNKLPTVNMNLFFDVPPFVEGDKAGVTEFFGSLLRAGTENYTKEALDEELDYNGIDLFAGSQSIGISTLKKRLPTAVSLMKEVLFNPTFDNQGELDKLVTQSITGLKSAEKNPDAIMGRVNAAVTYGTDHPWGEYATEETYQNITLNDIKTHYNTYFKPNIGYLTIVGDVTFKEAKKLVKKNFKKWKPGEIPAFEYAVPENPGNAEIALIDLPTATQSNIFVTNVQDLKKAEGDYFAALLGNHVLGGSSFAKLFLNLREDKGYTYGAYSSLDNDHRMRSTFTASAKVRNEVTDSSLMEFYEELNAIVNKPLTKEDLKIAKSERTGRFALGLENPSTLATYARTIFREDLDGNFYSNYLKALNDVSASDVQKAMQRYIKPQNSRVFIVGKAADILPDLQAMGMPIKFYDIYGNETGDPTQKVDVGDVTAEAILGKYLDAMGGKEKLEAVQTMHMTYGSFIQGLDITIDMKAMVPNKTSLVVSAPGMGELQTMKFDGTKGSIGGMQGSAEFDEKQNMDTAARHAMFPELTFVENLENVQVDNIVEVDGQKAYKLLFSLPSGLEEERYYNVDSGLLVKTVTVAESQGQQMISTSIISDYKAIEGIMTPHKMVTETGGMVIDMSLVKGTFDEGVTEADF
ncbi:MAG: insulinase family protein [Saprospiraceae bacterium]|nr:insulinase family protein [Saprospiraceae bacterium]